MDAITVLYYEVDKVPVRRTGPNNLEWLQALVGGYIEMVRLFDEVFLVCNEEGKLNGLPQNRIFGAELIVGNFFVAASDGNGEFADLTDAQIARVLTMSHPWNSHVTEPNPDNFLAIRRRPNANHSRRTCGCVQLAGDF